MKAYTSNTVSYTHLDVYKRQAHHAVIITVDFFDKDGGAPLYSVCTGLVKRLTRSYISVYLIIGKAVSYTHLDVYKRQAIGYLFGIYGNVPCLNGSAR